MERERNSGLGDCRLRTGFEDLFCVMAGLGPAIHVFVAKPLGVDARHTAGHDDLGWMPYSVSGR
jgi:hypothetical protein